MTKVSLFASATVLPASRAGAVGSIGSAGVPEPAPPPAPLTEDELFQYEDPRYDWVSIEDERLVLDAVAVKPRPEALLAGGDRLGHPRRKSRAIRAASA